MISSVPCAVSEKTNFPRKTEIKRRTAEKMSQTVYPIRNRFCLTIVKSTDTKIQCFSLTTVFQAQALTEVLTAVFFIIENIQKNGYEVSTMSDAARNFIANWESEKYRSTLNEKK